MRQAFPITTQFCCAPVCFSVVDRYIYGSLLYSLLTVWVLPPWLLLYLAIFSPSDTPSAPPADTLIPAEKKDQ